MRIGLRVDVDTLTGTRDGVPRLLALLARHGIHGTFFFTAGPDNMGRHLWRLLRPRFLVKMLRTRAASLYGWDILLRGTFVPGPRITTRHGDVLRATAAAGHEIGVHAWDHHRWQMKVETMGRAALREEMERAFREIERCSGVAPACSAVPGWRCTADTLLEKESFPFTYNSDCRGTSIFRPVVCDRVLPQIQIPVTLPTYDEVVGGNGITAANYNDHLLSLLKPEGLNVLCIHAEVEGGVCLPLFEDFLVRARACGAVFMPLRELLPAMPPPAGRIEPRAFPGREGWLAVQEPAVARDGVPG